MLNWFYFSDTNSPEVEIKTILQKHSYNLSSFYNIDDLMKGLKYSEHVVLFLKANIVYNAYDLCQEISIKYPHVYIVLVVPDNMESIKKAMHVGAYDLLRYSDEAEEKLNVIIQAEKYMKYRQKQGDLPSFNIAKNSRVISICSPKGGIGRTSMTVNLATAFVKQGKKVAVVDANMQFGDVSMFFDLKPKLTIYEWVKEGYEKNNYDLDNYLLKHNSGVSVLAAPPRPEFFEMINGHHIETAIEELKRQFDIILVDTPEHLSDVHLSCLKASEDLLLLTRNDLPVLRRTKLYIETLDSLQLRGEIKIIINRETKNKRIDAKKVEEILGKPTLASLPSQENIAIPAENEGIPFVLTHARAPITKAILVIAKQLSTPKSIEMLTPRSKKVGIGV